MAINWQDVVISVFTTVGGGAVLLGAAAYLIKTSISHRLAQETETFKAQLKAKSDAEIERLKNSLQIAALEHQIRFSKLHERRAEIIAELYKQLVEVDRDSRLFVYSGYGPVDRKEQFNDIAGRNIDFIQFINVNRIYIPLHVCELLDRYIMAMRSVVIDVNIYREVDVLSEKMREQDEVLRKAYSSVEKEIPKMKEAIDQEFRTILGETQGQKGIA